MKRDHLIARIATALLASAVATNAISPVQAQDRGFAERDDRAAYAAIGFLDRKEDVSPELFTQYWRDVHGPLAARIQTMHQYWQHHLGDPDPTLLPASLAKHGVQVNTDPDRQIEGIGEVTFLSAEDRAAVGKSAATPFVRNDQQNFMRGSYLHATVDGGLRTIKDMMADASPQGESDAFRVFLLIRMAKDAERARFARMVTYDLPHTLSLADDELKIRFHLLAPFDSARWQTPSVNNELGADDAHDAIIELVAPSGGAARDILARWGDIGIEANLISSIEAYPAELTYTLVYDGRPTAVGIYGYPAFEAIRALGAANQLEESMLRLRSR